MNDEPSSESYARLAQAQAEYKGPSAQESVLQTLDRLKTERDSEVTAGLPTKYNQQTLVGNISGAGNRHVIEDTQPARRPINFPSQISDNIAGGCTPDTPPDTGTWVWGAIDGECQWIDTTDCST